MSQLTAKQIEAIKAAVSEKLGQVAAGWHSQSKMNPPETEYGAGYFDGQEGCSEHLYELIDEVLWDIDQAAKDAVEDDAEDQECAACSGSGWYDSCDEDGNSIPCGGCDGQGKVRER